MNHRMTKSMWIGTLAAFGFGAAMALQGGCSRSLVEQPLDAGMPDHSEASEMDFWHSLPGRSAVSNSEGFHGVLLLADGADETATYEERLAVLKERGWVSGGFDEAGDLAMQRGTLAKAICHAMEIKGGVMMHLTNRSARYAMRELAYVRIMAPSTENQVVSGLDYVGVISKAQDYAMLRASRQSEAGASATEEDKGRPAGDIQKKGPGERPASVPEGQPKPSS